MNLRYYLGILSISGAALLSMAPGACRDVDSPAPPPGEEYPESNADFVVTVDPTQQFQTMTGWEAVAQAGQAEPDFLSYKNELYDKSVNELGINRLRLHVRSGSENRIDYYVRMRTQTFEDERCERWLITNDNANPNVIDPAGFKFSELDTAMVTVVLPIKQRVEARGEKLVINLNYAAFLRQCPVGAVNYIHSDPAEYAEIVLAAFKHMQSRYGIVPDIFELMLEPDNVAQEWNGTKLGNALVRTAAVLAANGFHPKFAGPSTSSMLNAISYAEDMLRVPGAAPLVSEITYHRYGGVSDENVASIANIARQYGTKTAMLEHISSGVDDLYDDLTIGNASAWQQFTLGMGAADGGGQYYQILNGHATMASRTRYLRQYFHYVRLNARRIGASSSDAAFRVVAFQNANGGQVVIVHTRGTGSVEVRGLAAGRYGASITTETDTGKELPEVTASAGSPVVLSPPGKGVLTIYRK